MNGETTLAVVVEEDRCVPFPGKKPADARLLAVRQGELDGDQIPPGVVQLVPDKLIRKYGVFPVAIEVRRVRTALLLATAHPEDLLALDDIAFACGCAVEPVLASRQSIDAAILRRLDAPAPAPRMAAAA